MRKLWEYSRGYSVGRIYVDLVTRAGFRSVTVENADRIPREGRIFLVPNHCAAMNDPLLLLLLRPREPIAFGARSDIFAGGAAISFLRWLRILPIAREQDGRRELARNLDVFDEIVDIVNHDVPFCMFAEGTHRPERGVMPLKKGIFRVAAMAAAEGDTPVYAVPVGIDYEFFFRPMGRVAVRVGEPVDIGALFGNCPAGEEAKLYSRLCADFRETLLSLTGKGFKKCRIPYLLRIVAALLSLPIFAVCAVAGSPIWLVATLIMLGFKDKAWTYTVHFVLRLLLMPLWPFYAGFYLLLSFYSSI